MKGVDPPSGRTIVLELVKEMEDGLYPLLYRVLPPSVYHVYLHPDDYQKVEAITALIVADATRALSARVAERNAQSRWSAFIKGKEPPIEVPAGGWDVHIHRDANGELERGALGIVSRLSLPPPPQFEGGTPTTRIVRTVITGTIRKSTTTAESTPTPAVVAKSTTTAEPTPALVAKSTATAAPTPAIVDEIKPEDRQGFASLNYVDESGPHMFVMRKDVITIGRGGSAHWVDVQVTAGTRVSREHCRIRRNADGRFFLQDVSTWGTSVDGQKVPPYLRQSAAGPTEETGEEHELSRNARIQLADTVLIEFHA